MYTDKRRPTKEAIQKSKSSVVLHFPFSKFQDKVKRPIILGPYGYPPILLPQITEEEEETNLLPAIQKLERTLLSKFRNFRAVFGPDK